MELIGIKAKINEITMKRLGYLKIPSEAPSSLIFYQLDFSDPSSGPKRFQFIDPNLRLTVFRLSKYFYSFQTKS